MKTISARSQQMAELIIMYIYKRFRNRKVYYVGGV